MLPSSGSRRDRVSSYPKDMNVPVVVSQIVDATSRSTVLGFFFQGLGVGGRT